MKHGHKSIRSLGLSTLPDLIEVVDILPHLEALSFTGDLPEGLDLLYNWEDYWLTRCPFPKLVHLEVSYEMVLPDEEFDAFMDRRFADGEGFKHFKELARFDP